MHDQHPGHEVECHLKYKVTGRGPWGHTAHCGYGCEMTGGHCVPGPHCDARSCKAKQQDEFRALIVPSL